MRLDIYVKESADKDEVKRIAMQEYMRLHNLQLVPTNIKLTVRRLPNKCKPEKRVDCYKCEFKGN